MVIEIGGREASEEASSAAIDSAVVIEDSFLSFCVFDLEAFEDLFV